MLISVELTHLLIALESNLGEYSQCYIDQLWKGSDSTVPTTEWIYILLNYPDLSQFKFSLGIVIQGRCYRKKKENEECFYFVIVVIGFDFFIVFQFW